MYFLFNRTTLQFLLHTLQVLYMCTVCDSTDINTMIEFVRCSISAVMVSVAVLIVPLVLGYLQEEEEHKPDP
jgi:hypothetical protein